MANRATGRSNSKGRTALEDEQPDDGCQESARTDGATF